MFLYPLVYSLCFNQSQNLNVFSIIRFLREEDNIIKIFKYTGLKIILMAFAQQCFRFWMLFMHLFSEAIGF